MNLKEIASVSGKSGLFKILKPTRSGVILETIDSKKDKHVAGATSKVSILSEISIYTTSKEGNKPLEEVLKEVHKLAKGQPLGIDLKKATNEELKEYFRGIVPDYDTERVYASDIKKLLNWYTILTEYFPDIFVEEIKEEEIAVSVEEKQDTEVVAKPAKPKAAKEPKVAAAKTANPGAKATKQNTSGKNVTKNIPSKRGG